MPMKQAGLFTLCAIVLLIALSFMETEYERRDVHFDKEAPLSGFYLAPTATAPGGFVNVARLSEQSDERWRGIEE